MISDVTVGPKPVKFLDYKERMIHRLNAIFLFLGSLLLYTFTMSPSVAFWDAGEYIACSAGLCVPHPPGNPFYILMGRMTSLLPLIGFSTAQKVSFLSCLFAAFSVLFLYLIVVRFLRSFYQNDELQGRFSVIYLPALFVALATAFSNSFWTNSLEAEVYAGLAFFVTLCTWLMLKWAQSSEDYDRQGILLLIIYLSFLGVGVHQTVLQVAPAFLFFFLYPLFEWRKIETLMGLAGIMVGLFISYAVFSQIGVSVGHPSLGKYGMAIFLFVVLYYLLTIRKKIVNPQFWVWAFFLIIAGLSVHLFLPIRSAMEPYIDEGNPQTWNNFWDYIFRKQYGTTNFFERNAPFGYQFNLFLTYTGWQFFNFEVLKDIFMVPKSLLQNVLHGILVIAGFFGLAWNYIKNRRKFVLGFFLVFFTTIVMVFVMNLTNHEVRDRDYFWVAGYLFWLMAAGFGFSGAVYWLRKKSQILSGVIASLMIILPMLSLVSHFDSHDRRGDYIAHSYGANLLNGLEKDAILFTNGDNDTFPLWYVQAVDDPISVEYLPEQGWIENPNAPRYDQNADPNKYLQRTDELQQMKYQYYPDMYRGLRRDVTVANLSLLNTPWYLKQLKHKFGVAFSWSDEEMDRLMPIRLQGDQTLQFAGMTVHKKQGDLLMVNEQAIWNIVRSNFGKRPIYFAVTCSSFGGLEKYLSMEGLVYRVTGDIENQRIDGEQLEENIYHVYQYPGSLDPKVYKDENTKRLVSNYGAGFARLGQYYSRKNQFEKAGDNFFEASKYAPDNHSFLALAYQSYSQAEIYNKARKVLTRLINLGFVENGKDAQLQYARLFYNEGQVEKALQLLGNLYDSSRDAEVLQQFLLFCQSEQLYDRALAKLRQIKNQEDEGSVDHWITLFEQLQQDSTTTQPDSNE